MGEFDEKSQFKITRLSDDYNEKKIIITLLEYKRYLVDYYRYEIDNTPLKREERKKGLAYSYSDEYLQKIIDDTYSFLNDIFNSSTIELGYCEFKVLDARINEIYLNISGGYSTDFIYPVSNGRLISEYILQQIFGDNLIIDITEEVIEGEEDDVVSLDYCFYLYIQGFPKNMKELKEMYLGKARKKEREI